ncbi:MAG: SpoIIE family protein phosphatase [Holophagales bacterium]|nr:SpoIIE family protein phosphatase [Holophagales bacterium]MBK9965976.1 SpoIIE family protein phosphatase [Holophagales bacterium]
MSRAAMTSTIEKRLQDLRTLLEVAQAMTGVRQLQPLLELIIASATRLIDADRTSLFLLEPDGSLWTRVAQDSTDIRLPPGFGIAGIVARTGQTITIADAYEDPRFSPSVDLETGYRTRSILCIPLTTPSGSIVGVIEAMNKKGDLAFDADDEESLRALGSHAAVALETQRLLDGELQRQRMEGEIELARKIQENLRPRRLPEPAWLRLAAWQKTAEKTGGDYYDVMEAPGGSFDLLVCDVSGHGLASTVLMSAARAYLRALHLVESNPQKLIEKLNRLISPDIPDDAFATLVACRIGPAGDACYVSAGHLPPLVYRPRTGRFDALEETDIVLGFSADTTYRAHQIDRLEKGDLVVLATDGLYEAASPGGLLWGLDAVRDTIAAAAPEGAHGVIEALRAGVFGHSERLFLDDDITLVAAERL